MSYSGFAALLCVLFVAACAAYAARSRSDESNKRDDN